MKIAVEISEKFTKTVIIEADNYEEAENKVMNAYSDGGIFLDANNSSVEFECTDDTKNYIEIFGKDEFEKMEVSPEFQ